MKIENTEVHGFRAALRGMRNPLESWDKADSEFYGMRRSEPGMEGVEIGPLDLALACKLIRSGGDHRKFLRQIQVWCDITIPRDVWQELDTYKVATVRNSCSTMHNLGSRELTTEDFENRDVHPAVLTELNAMGLAYRSKVSFISEGPVRTAYSGVGLLEHMKHRLPEGYLQRATWSANYETLLKLYHSRRDHRMPQWSGLGGICAWVKSLPYMEAFLKACR